MLWLWSNVTKWISTPRSLNNFFLFEARFTSFLPTLLPSRGIVRHQHTGDWSERDLGRIKLSGIPLMCNMPLTQKQKRPLYYDSPYENKQLHKLIVCSAYAIWLHWSLTNRINLHEKDPKDLKTYTTPVIQFQQPESGIEPPKPYDCRRSIEGSKSKAVITSSEWYRSHIQPPFFNNGWSIELKK